MKYMAGFLMGLWGVYFFWRKAKKAPPEIALEEPPQREGTFNVDNVDLFLSAMTSRAEMAGYALALDKRGEGKLVFSDTPTLYSFGFYYPVIVEEMSGKGSIARVGITSRAMQMGPVVTSRFEKFTKLVEKCLK